MRLPLILATAIGLALQPLGAAEKPPLPATPRQQPDAGWEKAHADMSAEAKKGGVDLLFVGDSITRGWKVDGKQAWAERFAQRKVANFGIGGDRTEHILYRLQNGELDGLAPKLVVLLIGTNNSACGHRPEDTAAGIAEILKTIRDRCPAAKTLLLSILPRGDGRGDPVRVKNEEINRRIAALDDGGTTVRFLDVAPRFVAPDGTLAPDHFQADHVHLAAKGYETLAAEIAPVVAQLLE
jgi:lysophospholipase L1-like esterase